MELADYVRILRRRWVLIAFVILACVGGAAIATKLTATEYQASARLIVNGSSVVSPENELANRQLAIERATAFAQIITTDPAIQAALKEAESKDGPFSGTGSPSVSASASGTDPFINVQVTDTDPHRAQAVANAFGTVLPRVLTKLDQPPTQANEIEILDPASLPSSPSSPKVLQDLLIGLGLGIVLGVGAAFAVESMDRRLKDSDDVEKATGLTILGVVPFDMPREPIPSATHPMSVRSEAYRKVRTNLAFVSATGNPKSVIITSATSAEGKTSVAVNLAISSARTAQRVILIDADLRRPMVEEVLRMPHHLGLVDVLAGTANLSDAIQFSEEGQCDVLVSGPVPSNPNELLGSATMRETISQLERDYDFVIIDTPPILPVADALNLSVNVDGVVIVTRLGETTRDRLRRTKEALDNVHANILGVVPNGAVQGEDRSYSYAYRYSSRRKPSEPLPHSRRDAKGRSRADNSRATSREDQDLQLAAARPSEAPTSQAVEPRSQRRAKHGRMSRGRPEADMVPPTAADDLMLHDAPADSSQSGSTNGSEKEQDPSAPPKDIFQVDLRPLGQPTDPAV